MKKKITLNLFYSFLLLLSVGIQAQNYVDLQVTLVGDNEDVDFQFAPQKIDDAQLLHTYLEDLYGDDLVEDFNDDYTFTLYERIYNADLLQYLTELEIVLEQADYGPIKMELGEVPLEPMTDYGPATFGYVKTNVPDCMLPVDDTHIVVPGPNGCDDCTTPNPIQLQFEYDICGSSFSEVYINSNGNITFDQPYTTYTPEGIPNDNTAIMVAPFWGDVDTDACDNGTAVGLITYKSESNRLIVTWTDVGYFNDHCDLLNTFQVIISDGTDPEIGLGNNTAFYYGEMSWTTGDASDGVGGFGGSPATVGINANDGTTYSIIGRFDHPGTDSDGPEGEADGVDFLDFACYEFAAGDCSISGCALDELQVELDVDCEQGVNGPTGNYIVFLDYSGVDAPGVIISGDVDQTGAVILDASAIDDGTVDVIFTIVDACADTISMAAPNCTPMPIDGCTDPAACNFNPAADMDDGSCLADDCLGECGGDALPGTACDDGNALTNNDTWTADCECIGFESCDADAGTLQTATIEDFYCSDNPGVTCVSTGFQTDALYAQAYILTDASLEIMDINLSGSFFSLSPNTYILHALNTYASELPGDPTILVGSNAGDVLATLNCYDLKSSDSFVVLKEIEIVAEYACNSETAIYTLTFGFTGGLPEYVDDTGNGSGDDIFYFASGDLNGAFTVDDNLTLEYADATTYSVTAIDNNSCSRSQTQTPSACTKLSVELMNFSGVAGDRSNELDWITASEKDNAFYTLERSTDGINFKDIAKLTAIGNSNITQNYQFVDQEIQSNVNFYRLLATDTNGNTEIVSSIIKLEQKATGFSINQITPNPAKDFTNVIFNSETASDINVRVYDAKGAVISEMNYRSEAGQNILNMNVSDFPQGIYFIQLNDGTNIETERFVK